MKAELKEPEPAPEEVQITMTKEEAQIIRKSIGCKCGMDDEKYYGNNKIHDVFYELYRVLDDL